MKIKTSELEGAALDWAVAKCEQVIVAIARSGSVVFDSYQDDPPPVNDHDHSRWHVYSPSTNWAQGGPIIERESIQLTPNEDMESWSAGMMFKQGVEDYSGPTPLTAAMRCYVASKLGDKVEVPDELAK